jgi:pimeloyl-ACP methyl ester carboxylesterase
MDGVFVKPGVSTSAKRRWSPWLSALLFVAWGASAPAEEPPSANGWLSAVRRSREALEWTDAVIRHDWRLQRRTGDGGPQAGSCRILDPADGTVRAGTEAECRQAFARLETEGTIPRQDGPTVILLHGLGEGRDSMRPLAEHLRQSLDATVILFGYASVKADIEAHGRALAEVVAGLPPGHPLSFVGHSLGNLVVRRWLSLATPADVARVERMVMLGPPNQGSQLARMASGIWGASNYVEGAARDLVFNWHQVAPGLAVPPCDFGIVAGGRGDATGYSMLLSGDDDAVVCVDETRLAGARDFLLVPVHHAAMMRSPVVQQATEVFLQQGRFPIPEANPEAAAR